MTSTKKQDKPLTPVMEDYLEAIFELDREKRAVRVKDIANWNRLKVGDYLQPGQKLLLYVNASAGTD